MAQPPPRPDHDRAWLPVPWEHDDTPGLSIHPLTPADADAILANLYAEPDTGQRPQPTPTRTVD